MTFKELAIKGLWEITPQRFDDNRGHFFEAYNTSVFAKNGLGMDFVQDNQSYSQKGVIRGLHFQKEPHAQGKLVRVLKGKVLDVALDIRKNSPTFGKSISLILDGEKNNMIYLPEGFAHGFAALEESMVLYKCTSLFNKASESGIRWDDPDLTIDWGIDSPIVSDKDKELKFLHELLKFGEF